jgi:hypothetical protein
LQSPNGRALLLETTSERFAAGFHAHGGAMADRKSPTPGEIIIMVSGGVALIFSFFDFYSVDTAFGGNGISAWSSGLFPVATLMVIFVTVMALQIALTKFANVSLPERVAGLTWEQVHLVLGFFAALYAIAYLLVSKGSADFGIGFWFVLIGCIGALVGAVMLQRERTGGPVT